MDKKIVERFWARVEVVGECWEVSPKFLPGDPRAHTAKRYQKFFLDGRQQPAHRVAFELTFGAIPEGQVIRHRCGNAACCRPAHLLLGTQQENMLDIQARKRAGKRRGELWTYEDG